MKNRFEVTEKLLKEHNIDEYDLQEFMVAFPDGAIFPDDLEKADRAGLDIECFFEALKLSGECVQYYDDGQIYVQCNYKDGKLNGEYKSYRPNGQIWEKCNYKNGKLDGKFISYYDNGQLKLQCSYKNGEIIEE